MGVIGLTKQRETIADRTRLLIDLRHGGSINAAARATGVPYPTLRGIVAGEIKNPRSDAVRKLADHYQVTTDWLLNGVGAQPPERVTIDWESALGEWWLRLHSLDLPETIVKSWALAPLGPWAGLAAMANALGEETAYPKEHAAIAWRSVQLSAQAWTTMLDEAAALYGESRLRDAILSIPPEYAREGFAHIVSNLTYERIESPSPKEQAPA